MRNVIAVLGGAALGSLATAAYLGADGTQHAAVAAAAAAAAEALPPQDEETALDNHAGTPRQAAAAAAAAAAEAPPPEENETAPLDHAGTPPPSPEAADTSASFLLFGSSPVGGSGGGDVSAIHSPAGGDVSVIRFMVDDADESSLNETALMVDHLEGVVSELRAKLAESVVDHAAETARLHTGLSESDRVVEELCAQLEASAAALRRSELRATLAAAVAAASLAVAHADVVAVEAENAVALAELDTFEQKMKLMAAASAREAEGEGAVAAPVLAHFGRDKAHSAPAALVVNVEARFLAASECFDDDAVTPLARGLSAAAAPPASASSSMTPATRAWYREAFEPELDEVQSATRGEGRDSSSPVVTPACFGEVTPIASIAAAGVSPSMSAGACSKAKALAPTRMPLRLLQPTSSPNVHAVKAMRDLPLQSARLPRAIHGALGRSTLSQ